MAHPLLFFIAANVVVVALWWHGRVQESRGVRETLTRSVTGYCEAFVLADREVTLELSGVTVLTSSCVIDRPSAWKWRAKNGFRVERVTCESAQQLALSVPRSSSLDEVLEEWCDDNEHLRVDTAHFDGVSIYTSVRDESGHGVMNVGQYYLHALNQPLLAFFGVA